jgi:hypothetical protein
MDDQFPHTVHIRTVTSNTLIPKCLTRFLRCFYTKLRPEKRQSHKWSQINTQKIRTLQKIICMPLSKQFFWYIIQPHLQHSHPEREMAKDKNLYTHSNDRVQFSITCTVLKKKKYDWNASFKSQINVYKRTQVFTFTPPIHTPADLLPEKRPNTHCTGGWMGPRAGLEECG